MSQKSPQLSFTFYPFSAFISTAQAALLPFKLPISIGTMGSMGISNSRFSFQLLSLLQAAQWQCPSDQVQAQTSLKSALHKRWKYDWSPNIQDKQSMRFISDLTKQLQTSYLLLQLSSIPLASTATLYCLALHGHLKILCSKVPLWLLSTSSFPLSSSRWPAGTLLKR